MSETTDLKNDIQKKLNEVLEASKIKVKQARAKSEDDKKQNPQVEVSAQASKAIDEYLATGLNNNSLSLQHPPLIGKPVHYLEQLSPFIKIDTVSQLGKIIPLFDSFASDQGGGDDYEFRQNDIIKDLNINYSPDMTVTIQLIDAYRVVGEQLIFRYLTRMQRYNVIPLLIEFGWYYPQKESVISEEIKYIENNKQQTAPVRTFMRNKVMALIQKIDHKYTISGELQLTIEATIDPSQSVEMLDRDYLRPFANGFRGNVVMYSTLPGILRKFSKIEHINTLSDFCKDMHLYGVCNSADIITLEDFLGTHFPISEEHKKNLNKTIATNSEQKNLEKQQMRLDGFINEDIPEKIPGFLKDALNQWTEVLKAVLESNESNRALQETIFGKEDIDMLATFKNICCLNINKIDDDDENNSIDQLAENWTTVVHNINILAAVLSLPIEFDEPLQKFLNVLTMFITNGAPSLHIHPAVPITMVVCCMKNAINADQLHGDQLYIGSPIFSKDNNQNKEKQQILNFITNDIIKENTFIAPFKKEATSILNTMTQLKATDTKPYKEYVDYTVNNSVLSVGVTDGWFSVLEKLISRLYIYMPVTVKQIKELYLATNEKQQKLTEGKEDEDTVNLPIPLKLETEAPVSLCKDDERGIEIFKSRNIELINILMMLVSGKKENTNTTTEFLNQLKPYDNEELVSTPLLFYGILTLSDTSLLGNLIKNAYYLHGFSYRPHGIGDKYNPGHDRVFDVNFPDVVSCDLEFDLRQAGVTSAGQAQVNLSGDQSKTTVSPKENELNNIKNRLKELERYIEQTNDDLDKLEQYHAQLLELNTKLADTENLVDNYEYSAVTYNMYANDYTESNSSFTALRNNYKMVQEFHENMLFNPDSGFSAQGDLRFLGNCYFDIHSMGKRIFIKYYNNDGSLNVLTGNYIINGISHNIASGEFYTTLKIQRDPATPNEKAEQANLIYTSSSYNTYIGRE